MTLEQTKADALAVIKAQLAQHAANTCHHRVLVARCRECSKTATTEESPA